MGRTNISAGRMAREPSLPKPVPVNPPPPPTTTGDSTPSSSPETTIAPPPFSPLQHTSSPPSKPHTKKRPNKPRPESDPQPVSTRTRPLTLRSGKKIAPPLTGAQAKVSKPQPLTHAQAKLGVLDSSSSDELPECEEAASNSPEPKRKKIAQMQLRNSPKCDNAVKTKHTQEKEAIMKHQRQRPTIVDESTEDVAPMSPTSSPSMSLSSSPSHSNGNNSSLRTSVALLTTAVLMNTRTLQRQEEQLNRLQTMVQSLSNRRR